MNTYLHPLDYPLGLKHYLTNLKIDYMYTPSPDSFYVEELIDYESLNFNSNLEGNYLVYRVIKKNIDTWEMLRRISSRMNIPEDNIIILGLKDRDATTQQYLFINKNILRNPSRLYIDHMFKAELIGSVSRKPSRKHLLGNKFRIILSGIDHETYLLVKEIMKTIMEKGLPSYYGYQRFGTKRFNTHILGKYLLENRLDYFLDELFYRLYPGETIESLISRIKGSFGKKLYYEHVAEKLSRFRIGRLYEYFLNVLKGLFIDAYQSYLFNLLLSSIIDRYGWSELDKAYPTPSCNGSDKYYDDILRVESISYELLRSKGKCWWRHGLFYPRNMVIQRISNKVVIEFILDKGMYATIIMRELFKDNLVLS